MESSNNEEKMLHNIEEIREMVKPSDMNKIQSVNSICIYIILFINNLGVAQISI